MDALAFRLLNDYQRGFPLVPRPFLEIATGANATEEEVLQTFGRLQGEGKLSRIGAVFRPNTVGASVLAALCVPAERLAQVARLVSAQPGVNHNYEREHRYNLWFVVTAADPTRVDAALDRIESACALKALRLPLEEEYHIDLGFDLASGAAPRCVPVPASRVALTEAQARLVAALERGLPLVPYPFRELGRSAGLEQDHVLEILSRWLEQGVMRRFGTVLRHRSLGFEANAMVVWDVPDAEASAIGRQLAAHPAVTLCYRRARQRPDWPYNLFCMVHGKERSAVVRAINEAARAAGLEARPREVLFSVACFTQRGPRYAHG